MDTSYLCLHGRLFNRVSLLSSHILDDVMIYINVNLRKQQGGLSSLVRSCLSVRSWLVVKNLIYPIAIFIYLPLHLRNLKDWLF